MAAEKGTPEVKPPTPEEYQLNISSQVLIFVIIFIAILAGAMLILSSKMFRTYLSLTRLGVYKSNDIKLRNIDDIDKSMLDYRLRDFYIASAYRPYVCYFHKYDYVSVEIFKQIISAGPRMVELEVFNSGYGDKVEPVVSIGDEKGEWKYTLNSVNLREFFNAIGRVAFNNRSCKVFKEPFILYLNLKTNRNVKCLNKIHKYLFAELGQFLLGPSYSYNSKKNNAINDIKLKDCQGRVIVFASTGFEDTDLEELVNYSTVSNHTLNYFKDQRRILRISHDDIVETEEEIEDYVNTDHHKVALKDVANYTKYGFSILTPQVESDSVFRGINPINTEAGKGLEAGCQFIMMNYQKIDTNMSNYVYIFKDSSLVLKADQHIDPNEAPRKVFEGMKEERVNMNSDEVNFLYVNTK